MDLTLWHIQVQKLTFWKTDLDDLILDSWLVREWAIERERSEKPIDTCLYSYHSSFSFLLLVFCVLYFFPSVVLVFLLCTSMALLLPVVTLFIIFTPSTIFSPLWVSFQDCPLACRLPSHLHETVLVVPCLILRKK